MAEHGVQKTQAMNDAIRVQGELQQKPKYTQEKMVFAERISKNSKPKKPKGAWWSQEIIQRKYPYMILGLDWLTPGRVPRIEYRLQKAATSSTLTAAVFSHK